MNLGRVTPLILTRDEGPNVERLLAGLTWARRIVVVDSHSRDDTVDRLRRHPGVEVFNRSFTTFSEQWDYGLSLVETEWVLSLDADYVCPPGLVEELRAFPEDPEESGYSAKFRYAIFGRVLRGSLYPPRTVLFRCARATHDDDGHTQRVRVEGPLGELRTRLIHDDRKPFGRWLHAQERYVEDEAAKLQGSRDLDLVDRLRRVYLGPVLVPLHCLLGKGLILDGRAGLYYTLQRTAFEVLLALALLDRRLRPDPPSPSRPPD